MLEKITRCLRYAKGSTSLVWTAEERNPLVPDEYCSSTVFRPAVSDEHLYWMARLAAVLAGSDSVGACEEVDSAA